MTQAFEPGTLYILPKKKIEFNPDPCLATAAGSMWNCCSSDPGLSVRIGYKGLGTQICMESLSPGNIPALSWQEADSPELIRARERMGE